MKQVFILFLGVVIFSLTLLVSCGSSEKISWEIPETCKDYCQLQYNTAVYKEVAFSDHACHSDCIVNYEESEFCGCLEVRQRYLNCMYKEINETYKVAAVWFGYYSSSLDQERFQEIVKYCEYDKDDYDDCLEDCRQY